MTGKSRQPIIFFKFLSFFKNIFEVVFWGSFFEWFRVRSGLQLALRASWSSLMLMIQACKWVCGVPCSSTLSYHRHRKHIEHERRTRSAPAWNAISEISNACTTPARAFFSNNSQESHALRTHCSFVSIHKTCAQPLFTWFLPDAYGRVQVHF